MPGAKRGWGIIYNDAITSKGRINFTLAHEFGHYLLHREAYPDGLECGAQDMVRWDRSEEHTSELQSLMRSSYAVFCLKKKQCAPPQTDTPRVPIHLSSMIIT